MQINRQTYEEFFLLYVDNELSAEDRKAVEAFIVEHPDLAEELRVLQKTMMHPEKGIVFFDKKSLLKSEEEATFSSLPSHVINDGNYEEYFILYADNELTLEQRLMVDQFVQSHPRYVNEFNIFQKLKARPDADVYFPDKESLYHRKKDRRIILWRWPSMAAALLTGLALSIAAWYYLAGRKPDTHTLPDREQSVAVDKQPAINPAAEKESVDKNRPAPTAESYRTGEAAAKNTSPNPSSLAITGKQARGISESRKAKKEPAAFTAAAEKKSRMAGRHEELQKVADAAVAPPALAKIEEPAVAVEAVETAAKPVRAIRESITANENIRPYTNEFSSGSANAESSLIYVANTSVSRKSRFRGIFRKASRILEKTTHIKSSPDRESIRIANLEIALQ